MGILPRLKHSILFIFLLALTGLAAQPGKSTVTVEKGKQITIKNGDKAHASRSSGKTRIIGNVIFEHEGALMYCDSAWLFSTENRLQAFQNVRINQGDTVFLWGDYLEYSGNTKLAKVTGKVVRLKDTKMELLTDRVDYDRNTNLAYYFTGGVITNDENKLTSQKGFYNSKSKEFNFKDSVVLVNPKYTIESDTLIYNSLSRISYFKGKTTITSDSSFIYCENGRYNTVTDIAQFQKNAYLYNENKYLTGDSLYYEKHTEFGEAFGNVMVHDTIDDYVITGGYGQFTGAKDSTFVTLDPIYSVKQEQDTLHIHGDTLFSTKVKDTLIGDYRLVKVFHKVKFYKKDLQGKCDSLVYAEKDSIIRMYRDPIVWNDSSQVTGDTIFMTIRSEKLDSLKVFSNAFILGKVDASKSNQIKGRNMYGKFTDNKLSRVFVSGNGQTIYFPKDDQKKFIGMNRAVCSNILMKLKDSQVKSITFLTKPEAKLYPISESGGENGRLEGLSPRFSERPKSKAEILIW